LVSVSKHNASLSGDKYSHVTHNDVSVNDGPHIRQWSNNVMLLYNIIIHTAVLQLPTVFSTVTCCTGL